MDLRGKLFIALVIIFFKNYGQDSLIHTFFGYSNLIDKDFRYYSDSISKRNKSFFVEVYISRFDTLNKELKLTLDYSYYDPLYLFNPTHIMTINNIIFAIRFSKLINYEIIHKLQYHTITSDDIDVIQKLNKQYVMENHASTYSSQPFVFHLKNNQAIYKWYRTVEDTPKEDRVLDYEYSKSGLKYKYYLKLKLKEYGYL